MKSRWPTAAAVVAAAVLRGGCSTAIDATQNAVDSPAGSSESQAPPGRPLMPVRDVAPATVSPTCKAGEVRLWSGTLVGGLPAQGQSLAVSSNAPLAGAIGNKFGGDGVNNISLPDLRQSVPVTWTSYAVCDSDGQQASSNGFVGQVRLFAGPLPTGTIAANGQSVLVSEYPILNDYLQGRFGTADSAHFNVPNLASPAPGMSYAVVANGAWPYHGSVSNMLTDTSEVLMFASPYESSIGGLGGVPADGRQLSVIENEALHYLVGGYFGGNGRTSFNMPNINQVAPANISYYVNQNGVFPAQRPPN